ncbi:MAG: hypothetical protein AAGH57_10700 [Pseudomonadota bacterium]
MAQTPPLAATLALAAALSMTSPLHAAPLSTMSQPATTGTAMPLIDGFSSSSYDADAHVNEWRRCGWYGCYRRGWRRGWRGRRGISTGDVLAGAVIIGGIAAIASSANRRRAPDVVVVERDRPRDVVVVERDAPQDYDYAYERERYESESALRREIERDRELDELRRRTEEQQLEIEELRRQGVADLPPVQSAPPSLAPLPPISAAPPGRANPGPVPVPDPLPSPTRGPLPRSSDGSIALEGAVERCTEVIAIDDSVSDIDGAVRTRNGWSVRGRLKDGQEFTCRVNRNGQIEALNNGDFTKAAPRPVESQRASTPQRAAGQWNDDRYAEARAAIAGQSQRFAYAEPADGEPLVPLTSDRMPAYPGGPVPGQ